jgi:hypothetical protein
VKDQAVMSKTNGQLAIAIPLYRLHHDESLGKMEGYMISLTKDEPLAYVLDCDELGCKVLSAEFIETHCEFLGDL